MREILFRAKAKDTENCNWTEDNGFVFGGIAFDGCTDDTYITRWNSFGLGFIENIEVDSSTVGQFTGLLDKNGKKIFDGDIVRTQYGRLCKVRWFSSPGYCGWDLTPTESWNPPPMKYELFTQKNLTVIGNKWDNPELLK